MNVESGRSVEIDILKTIGVISVIFVHLALFIPFKAYWFNMYITQMGLSCFFFSSAYTLSKYNNFLTDEKMKSFLIKRAKRIYPLYWIAIFVYIIIYRIFHMPAMDSNIYF